MMGVRAGEQQTEKPVAEPGGQNSEELPGRFNSTKTAEENE